MEGTKVIFASGLIYKPKIWGILSAPLGGTKESFVSEWGFPLLESFGHSLRLLGFAFQLNPWREIEKFYFPIQ